MTTTHQPFCQASDPKAVFRRAKQAYEADPDNGQKRRAMGWALADLLKDVSGNAHESTSRVVRGLAVVSEFPMDPTDLRWRESVLWSVNRFLLRVPPPQLSLTHLAEIISHSRTFVELSPSLVRSVWWKALLRHSALGDRHRLAGFVCGTGLGGRFSARRRAIRNLWRWKKSGATRGTLNPGGSETIV